MSNTLNSIETTICKKTYTDYSSFKKVIREIKSLKNSFLVDRKFDDKNGLIYTYNFELENSKTGFLSFSIDKKSSKDYFDFKGNVLTSEKGSMIVPFVSMIPIKKIIPLLVNKCLKKNPFSTSYKNLIIEKRYAYK